MNNNKYDYILVGGGPTSLTVATILINENPNSKIIILDNNKSLGGQNRTIRGPNGEFEEHSPRFQSGAYLNFKTILKDMGLNFNDLFTQYTLPVQRLFPALPHLSIPTLVRLTITFILFLIDDKYGNDIPLIEIAGGNKKDISFLNQITRLVDGGTVHNTRLNQLFQIINQNTLYGMYQPNETTDTGLFKQWEEYLYNKGVEIKLNIKVVDIEELKGMGNKIILAIPPIALSKLIPSYNLIAEKTAYSKYIPITFHWKNKYNIPIGNDYTTEDDLGLISIPTSNYTKDPISPYKTVISSVISNISNYQNKEQAYEQLKLSIPYLNSIPPPDDIIIYNDDSVAFFNSIYSRPIPFQTPIENVYTVGTHNLKSKYDFTSVESSCTNAFAFVNYLGIKKKIKYGWTLRDIIVCLFSIFIIYLIFKECYRKLI